MMQQQQPPPPRPSSPCWSLRRILTVVLVVLVLQVTPAVRDDAVLKARLSKCVGLLSVHIWSTSVSPSVLTRPPPPHSTPTAESLVIVNQSAAIQQLASKLSAELGRENHLALFGAQARTAARAVLGELTNGAGCLQWDPTQAVAPGHWVTSPSQVQAAVGKAYQAVASTGGSTDVVVVVEHMEKLDCANVMHLNNLMAAMDRPDGSFAPPTFLFLFEQDVARRDFIEGGIRSYWLEAIDKECRPGAALNLRAFFGRLTQIIFEPLPAGTPPDTQALCSALPRGRGGLLGLGWPFGAGDKEGSMTSRILAVAAVGLVVVGAATYAITRATAPARGNRAAAKAKDAATPLAAAGAMEEDPDKVLATLTSARGGNKGKTTRRRSASPAPVAVVADDGATNGDSGRATRASMGGNKKPPSSSPKASSSRRMSNAKRE